MLRQLERDALYAGWVEALDGVDKVNIDPIAKLDLKIRRAIKSRTVGAGHLEHEYGWRHRMRILRTDRRGYAKSTLELE